MSHQADSVNLVVDGEDLAGTLLAPDPPRNRAPGVLFVHGCFWHQHNCRRTHTPRTNLPYWSQKLERNRNRDQANRRMLIEQGWRVLVIWECEIEDRERVQQRLKNFLG